MVPSVCKLQSQINDLRYGVVTVRSPSGASRSYIASADSGTARMAVLAEALASVQDNDTVTIRQGAFAVVNGAPLTSFIPSGIEGTHLVFGPGSSLIYATPADAGDDALLFRGDRNPVHFGAVPDTTFEGTPPDSWKAFETCRYSLPLVDDSSEDEFGKRVRTGTVVIPDGIYTLSAPFTSQAGQTWRGAGGRTILRWAANIATQAGATVRWAWTVARTDTISGPLANFTHDVNLAGMVFDRLTGNELLGGLNFSGAQGSSVTLMTIVGFGAGIYCQPYTSNVDFSRIDINFTTGKVGAGFEMNLCSSNLIRSLSVVQHNAQGAEEDADDTRYSSAIKLTGCRANTFLNMLAENCPRSIMMDSCELNVFSTVEASSFDVADSCLLDTTSGGQNVFHTLRGYNMEVLIRLQGTDVQTGLADDWLGTNYTQGTRYLETIQADRLVLPSTGKYFDVLRSAGPSGAQRFRWQSGQADSNPALTLTVSSADGTSSTEVLNIAKNNGGSQTGYHLTASNVYAIGAVNTEAEYRVDGVKVLGNQSAAIADVTGGAVVDAECRAAFNDLLAKLRVHGTIAT